MQVVIGGSRERLELAVHLGWVLTVLGAAALPAATNLALGILDLLPRRPLDGRRLRRSVSRLVSRRRGKPARRLRIVDPRKPTDVWRVVEEAERRRAAQSCLGNVGYLD